MITYLIIDDEHIAHDIIKGYCDAMPNMKLMKHCYDAFEALEFLNQHKVDLIFLDLNMPKLKGFEFLKTLAHPPKVIVTTAYREFALDGYELNVVDYLLKPFGFERFIKAVNKATSTSKEVQSNAISSGDDAAKSIFISHNKMHTQIAIDSIQYIEAAGNYTKVVTESETITTRDKFSDTLASLPADGFVRVHKSFAVSKTHIKSIVGNRITIGAHNIPIGKVYKANVNGLLG
jgi:DNA-binding LytR/AlgR family response regulator